MHLFTLQYICFSLVPGPSQCPVFDRLYMHMEYASNPAKLDAGNSLVGQTLTRGESLVNFPSSSRFPWQVSDEWRCAVAFFGMFGETKDLPLQNASQFMFTPTSLGALLLSMQYKSLMGIYGGQLGPFQLYTADFEFFNFSL